MVQGPSLDAIDTVRDPPSLEAQINALKRLKNDIVGHDQRKELVVKQGIIEPLVNIISTPSKATGKRRVAETNGEHAHAASRSWAPEQEARLQAILILGSLASGGVSFVPPLLAAGTSHRLLDLLETESSPKSITATLQALRSLAESASIATDPGVGESLQIVKRIALPFASVLDNVLHKPTSTADQQLQLIIDIIVFSAKDEKARATLADHGVLEALASLLVSYFVAHKHVDYRGSYSTYRHSPHESLIPDVLLAIAEITKESNYRTQCFILSSHVCEMMSNSSPINADSRFAFGSRHGFQNPMDGLLPQLPTLPNKAVSFNSGSNSFPALASLRPNGDKRVDARAAERGSDQEHASAVLSWLLFFARSMQGMDRLIALRLVAQVNNAIEADVQTALPRSDSSQRAKEREFQISMLAIPLAMQFVQLASEGKNEEPNIDQQEYFDIKEQACEVLALLIKGYKDLQSTAVDAGAIKRVCPALKKTFDNVPIAKPMWPSRSSTSATQKDVPPSCKMGSRGLPPEIQHLMQCRQSALEAVAAIADKDDAHRKAILDSGVSTCILDSLKPFPADYFAQGTNRDKITPKDGNTKAVILASCDAARSLSRSVSLLRTSLIDAGIAKPVFELLKHQDLEVQIAATDVVCNLILDFSPMREDLMNAGVMKTLTEHARQSEMSLRLSSLWALKHLVLAAPRDVKIQCLEELGVGWLVGAIQGYSKDSGSGATLGGVSVTSSGGLSTPNAAGQKVDLLNPASMDVDDPLGGDDDMEQDEDEDGEMLYDEASSTHYQASQLRSTLNLPGHSHPNHTTSAFDSSKYLTAVREIEQNPTLLAKRDDVAIQEQALDFIRNLLNGEDCVLMFEHLLEQIGVEKIFSLLNDKLAPISTPSSSAFGQPKGSTSARPIYQPSELILNTVHVLCHIANGSPKHKQLLIAQKQLLQNWLPHFHHTDRRVRVLCVWTVNNLTWIEEERDRADAQKRIRELKGCGIEAAIRGLVNDEDLDVRERVRTALRQIDGS
jgi:hypothetical protein